MPQFDKHFTVEEANALLPELRSLLHELQGVRDHLAVHWEQAEPVVRAARSNGGGSEGNAYLSDVRSLSERLRRMAALGVQLKDLDRGLVDFPAWRDDREVLLCWHLEEERVEYWHELDSGFGSRKPL